MSNVPKLDLEYELTQAFLIGIPDEVLDISYSIDGRRLAVQIMILDGYALSEPYRRRVEEALKNYDLNITTAWISKEDFNNDADAWPMVHYQWIGPQIFVRMGVVDED